MSWLDKYFTAGYVTVQIAGVPLPQRGIANFLGSVAGADNPTNLSTDITITGGGGGGGTNLSIAEVGGTSTVAVAPGITYEVNTTNGTPGAVTFTTQGLTSDATGSFFEAIRVDQSANEITLDAPSGGEIQDPNTYVFASTANLPTQNQSGSWYINGTTLRLY